MGKNGGVKSNLNTRTLIFFSARCSIAVKLRFFIYVLHSDKGCICLLSPFDYNVIGAC